jgi:uncharacterized membrane protein
MNTIQQFEGRAGFPHILYLGDDDLDRAAQYLGTIIIERGYSLTYVPSPLSFPAEINFTDYQLVILSDYPAARMQGAQMDALCRYVHGGGSLLMVGGWESFSGLQKEYTATPIAELLPVVMKNGDDRKNVSQGCAVIPIVPDHPAVTGLRWATPAIIGGYNKLRPKKNAVTVLGGRHLALTLAGRRLRCTAASVDVPLLVTWERGTGRCTALAFDLAPHWVGGFVDWGTHRVRIDANGAFIEVGDQYHKFVSKLLSFCIRKMP